MSLLRGVREPLLPEEDRDRRLPIIGRKQRAIRGEIMGRLEVTTATKVSRTAHDPAFWAPLMGSYSRAVG